MKICISSSGPDLSSAFNPRFGRCDYFIFLDSEKGEFEAVENTNSSADGAGVKSAALAGSRKPNCVLSGNIGPNAFDALGAAGIEVYLGNAATIQEAVDKYRSGEFRKAEKPETRTN